MAILLDGTGGVTTPGVVNTAGETIATTLSVTGATNLAVSSGNVGIGTSSPGAKLGVAGDVRILANAGVTSHSFIYNENGGEINLHDETGAGATLLDQASNSTRLLELINGSNLLLGLGSANTTGVVQFMGAGYVERMRIDSSGNLLVGTASTFSGTSFYQGSSGIYAAYFRQANASSPVGLLVNYSGASPNNTVSAFFEGNDTTTARVVLRSNGGIANYSANNVNLSDRREKTNFAPATSYLDKICAIPVQTFNYIDQNLEEDGGLTLGVVAQDVQAVAPELVMESNWAGKDDEPKMRLSIYQTDLQYALMKCIQEQQAIITQLQADVATLKALSA